MGRIEKLDQVEVESEDNQKSDWQILCARTLPIKPPTTHRVTLRS